MLEAKIEIADCADEILKDALYDSSIVGRLWSPRCQLEARAEIVYRLFI